MHIVYVELCPYKVHLIYCTNKKNIKCKKIIKVAE